jgi:hypothetical protein
VQKSPFVIIIQVIQAARNLHVSLQFGERSVSDGQVLDELGSVLSPLSLRHISGDGYCGTLDLADQAI